MAKVLMVGIDPDLVDFSDPALPPGINADMIRAGIARGMADLAAAGHDADRMYIPTDPAALGDLKGKLDGTAFDCVVVGGGVRLPPRNLLLFEAVVNVIAQAPSRPAIGLAARPDEAAAVVARLVG